MAQYINKDTLVAEIERIEHETNYEPFTDEVLGKRCVCRSLLSFLDTLEVKDPYEQCVQYDSIKAGIQAHAETYSFNIESVLFPQLTKEQQALWKKEIEQACISGGDAGVGLARDPRYKENLEVKEVDLEKFECPTIKVKDDVSVSSRMQYIDDELKPIAEFIMEYASWNLHKEEWNHPVLEVPLFRVLDALIQRGKPYCEG